MPPTESKFLKATTISRFLVRGALDAFLVRHPKLSRFLAHVPGVSRFMTLPAVAYVKHIKPVYNPRAKRPRPRFGL